MKMIGNILWILLGGWWIALLWLVFGLILCITIVGIPFGVQCFKKAGLAFAPFGKTVELDFPKHPIANTLWAIFFGWHFVVFYILAGVAMFVTIIGIPFGIQAFKFAALSFFPFGAKVV